MNSIEVGTCDICQKEGIELSRKYYHYDVQCECHSPNHFEFVRHCKDCKPSPPARTTVTMKPLEEVVK